MIRSLLGFIVALMILGCAQSRPVPAQPQAGSFPETKKLPVEDSYHGVTVVDDYRWLEDWNEAEVVKWSETQNAFARDNLDRLPGVDAIRAQVKKIVDMAPSRYYGIGFAGGQLFAKKFAPPANQPVLVVMQPVDPSTERTVLDLNELDKEGSTSMDWYSPSPNGKLVAVSLSKGGSESGDLHVYDVATGKQTDVVIPKVNAGTAGGDLAWTPDSTGFYYTRYPRKDEGKADADLLFFQNLWFHKIGTKGEEDKYEMGKDLPRIAEIEIEVEPKTGNVLTTVQNGDSGQFAHYLRSSDGAWKQLSKFGDGVIEMRFGKKNDIFFISRHEAPNGMLVHLASIDTPMDQAVKIVAEGDDAIVSEFYGARTMLITDTKVYLSYQLGGPSEIRVFDHRGKPENGPDISPVSSIGLNLVSLENDKIMYMQNTYIEPTSWFSFDPQAGATDKTALATDYPIDFSDVEVIRDFAVSKDGTKVPINIIRKKGIELNGSNPVLLNGYGGFGVSRRPRYKPTRRVWLDQGGVYAYSNLRGGAEYGEKWHEEGMLTKKQNVFDDFHACMKYLVEKGYTTKNKLVIEGGSNGGLLMGAMIAQHPSDMAAVVSHVGIYDMLRVELSANGSFNIPEYGTVKNEDQFKAMYAYSPYHNLVNETEYPAVLFMTGANDPRVDPMHSRKMTARLQAATASTKPVLLRTSSNTGHGLSAPLSERIEQTVDVFSFMFKHVGIETQKSH